MWKRSMGLVALAWLVGCEGTSPVPEESAEEEITFAPPQGVEQLDLNVAARRLRKIAGVPVSFQLWSSSKIARGTFFSRTRNSFGLAASDQVVEAASKAGKNGYRYTLFQQ